MFKGKREVDRHVSHLLSRCSSADERKSLGLGIAVLYIDVKEYNVAKGYLERYLQVNKESADAVNLLAWVNEAIDRPFETNEFRSTLNWNSVGTNVCEQSGGDVPQRGVKPHLSSQTTGKFSCDTLDIIKAQLLNDPTNVDICIRFIKFSVKQGLIKETVEHCTDCIQAGYHNNSSPWFNCFIDFLESLADNSELHNLLRALGRMMLVRITSSTSCLSDLRTNLGSLSRSLDCLSSDAESLFMRNEGEAWLYFYTAVYSHRRFRDLGDDSYCEDVLHQFYRRTVERTESNTWPCGILPPAIWKRLHQYRQEHQIQSMWLLRRYPSTYPENPLNSLSWNELLDLVHGEMKENRPVQSSQLNESTVSATKDTSLDVPEHLLQTSYNAVLMTPENLSLILWLCAQQSGMSSELKDNTLSNGRVEFLSKLVSTCFSSLDVSNLPLPFTECQSAVAVPADTACQLDLVCFLLAAFLQAAIRSLAGTSSSTGVGSQWIKSPVCITPTVLQPSVVQKQWWTACLGMTLPRTAENTVRPMRTPPVFHCGLNQLRLVARPARCFGKQSGIFPTVLLFRVASALTFLADKASGTERKHLIEDWAAGYWQAALQYQAFGIPPPLHTNTLAKTRTVPACSGTSTVLSDRVQLSSRASPGYSLSKVDSPGSQQIYHVLFTLPSDCNWWLGVQNPDSSKKVEWHWFNSGVCYLLTQLTRRSKEGGCVSDYGKTILRRLIRLLDGFDVHLSREAYRLGGQLLLTCTPENRILGYDEANAYTDNVSNSVAGDSLSNAQRARFYLERSSKSPQTIDNHSPADWHTPQSVDKSTPFRFRPSAWTDSVSTSLIVNRSSSPANSILDSRLNDTVEFPYIHLPLTPHASGGRLGNRQPDEDFRVENKTPANIHSLVPAGAESTDELDSSQYDVLSRSQEMLMSSFLSTWQSLVNGLSCQLAETKAELSRSRQLNEELSKQLNDTSKQLAEAINKFVECQEKLSKQSNQSVTAAANSDSFTDAIKLLQSPIRDLSLAINDLRRWLPEGMAAAASAAVSAHFSPQIPTSRAVFNSAEAAALMQFCGSNAPFATFNQIPVQSVPVNWRAPFFHPASNNPVPVPAEFKPRAPSSGIAATYVPSTVQQNGGVDFVNHQPDQTAGLTRQPNSLLASASLFPGASAPSTWENSSLRRDAVPKPPGRPDVTEQSFLTASLTTPIRPTSVVQSPAQLTFGSDRLRQDPNTSASLSTHGSRPLLGSGTDSPNYPTQPVVTNACTEPKPLLNLGLFQPSTISATISSRAAPIETKGTLASAITPEKPSLFGLENLSTSGSTPNSISLSSSAKPFGHSSPQQAHFSSVKSPSTSRNEEDSDQCPEAYEPKVDFTPVVSSLPDLIEQYTGEENEERLFADRARLFRFDKPTGSWKTRGVGEVRILHDIGGDKYRLVMRRDQVKKLCANHAITSNVHVTISTKDPRMAMWAVRDYAECPEGKDETFMIQFKSTELLQQFMDVVRECVTKCTSKSAPTPSTTTAASPVTNIPKANPEETHREEAIDLNAKFGLKPGEWNCSVCLVRNASGTSKCIACQTAKPVNPNETPKSEPASAKDPLLLKFAPQPGSWDCPTCMLHHTSTVQTCPACNTAKPSSGSSAQSSKPPSSTQLFGGFIMGGGGFVFGQQKPTSSTTDTATVTPSKPLFSFVGSASKPTTLFTPSPPQGSATTKVVSSTASLAADTKPLSSTFTKPSVFYFGRDPTSTTPATGPCVESEKTDKAGGAFASLNLLNGLGKTSGFSFNFGSSKTEGDTSKTVTSPTKDDDSPDTDQVELVDEEKLTFKPALAVMPDKIVLRTGEENEDIIFCERAKLYRWDVSVWRERGVGELKLLRNPSTGSVRCLMRRDHVLKVCCNHPITFGMQLKPMSAADGRAWTWWAIDFTEPSPDEAMNKSMDHSLSIDVAGGRPETFAVRFKTTEHAQLFKDVFNDAVAKAEKSKSSTATQELATKIQTVDLDGQNEPSDSDDVCVVEKPPECWTVFVSDENETSCLYEVTEEQLSRARQLRLPDEFYAFENGCVSGEAEPLTEQEEAEEDALLEAAIQRAVGARQRPDNSGESESDHVLKTEGAGALPTVSSQGDTAPTSTPSKSTSLGVPTSTNGTTTSLLASSKGTQLNSAFDGFSQSAGKLLDFSSLSANLSSDSKPTWGSPSAESKAQQSVWASATTPMFAAHTKKHELENGTEESGEQDPHYEPIISLPELVQTKSGEESELCLFFGRCRAYRFVDGAWKERGVGNIKVLVQPQSVPKGCKLGSKEIVPNDVDLGVVDRSRLLMRRDQVLKLCINQLIGSDVPMFKPMGNTGVCWVGEDYSEGSAVRETFAVRFKDETDLASFKAAVTRARNLLKKI